MLLIAMSPSQSQRFCAIECKLHNSNGILMSWRHNKSGLSTLMLGLLQLVYVVTVVSGFLVDR